MEPAPGQVLHTEATRARSQVLWVGGWGQRPSWPLVCQSPALGTCLSQKTEGFFPFQATVAAQKLWAFLEKVLCPPDIP